MCTHAGERTFGCTNCDKRFAQSSTLRIHMFSHTAERPFGCEVCEKKLKLASHLTTHMNIHTGERPFRLKLSHASCINVGERLFSSDKKLINSSYFIRHTCSHMSECLSCTVSDKMFIEVCAAGTHKVGQVAEVTFSCNLCNIISLSIV